MDMDRRELEGDQIRAQLVALRNGPKERLKRFRALEYVCSGCGETILSVMLTHPFRVIAGRPAADTQRTERAKFSGSLGRPSTVTEWMEFYRGRIGPSEMERAERENGSFVRIPDDFEQTVKINSQVHFLCRCREWNIPMVAIADDLRDGIRKRAWPRAS